MTGTVPLRGALAWILCGSADALPYVLEHQEFDAPKVLASHLADLMMAAGCFAKRSGVAECPTPKYYVKGTVANYEGPFRGLLDKFEGEFGAQTGVDLREFLEEQISLALNAVTKLISDRKLKATGIPIVDGRRRPAAPIRLITEEMALDYQGLLHECHSKDGRAWSLIRLDKNSFEKQFGCTQPEKNEKVADDEIHDGNFSAAPHIAKRRGCPESVSPRVRSKMREDIESKKISADELFEMKEEAMASRYACVRSTARKCRDQVLADLNYRQFTTNDN